MWWANVFFLGAKFNLKYLVLYLGNDGLKTNSDEEHHGEEEKDALKM